MQQQKLSSIGGIVVFLVFIVALLLSLWKYAGIGDALKETVTSVKAHNLTGGSKANVTFRIGYDGYLGYAVLESKRFRRDLEHEGIGLALHDDNANYPQRYAQLIKGDIDMAVMPIHDYLEQLYLTQPREDTLPLIIGAVSESRGADAVMSNPKLYPNIDTLKKVKQVKAAYTSKFMLGSLAVDANIPQLLQSSVDANPNIEKTFEGLLDGTYDVVGLWEPYISRAKEKGFKVLMGSDELKLGKIIDVFVINRRFLASHQEEVTLFLKHYYENSSYMLKNLSELTDEIEIRYGGDLSRADIATSLKGVTFYTLSDNAYTLFHVHSNSSNKILDIVDAIAVKLEKMKLIQNNPIPNEDARNIFYEKSLRNLFTSYEPGSILPPKKQEKQYQNLSHETWQKLINDPKFTRKDLKITFLRDGELNIEAKAALDDFAQNSINNFDYYVAVVGRLAKARGIDEEALIQRSEAKAKKVYEYLVKYWSIDQNRLHPIGLGSSGIRPPEPNENYYQYLSQHNNVELLFIAY